MFQGHRRFLVEGDLGFGYAFWKRENKLLREYWRYKYRNVGCDFSSQHDMAGFISLEALEYGCLDDLHCNTDLPIAYHGIDYRGRETGVDDYRAKHE